MGKLTDVLHDAKIAVRTLFRRPGISLVILVTLGVGLGAATTVFSVFDRLVLGPLPFTEPAELIRLRETLDLPGQGVRATSVAGRNFTEWRERATAFEDMAAARFHTLSLTGDGDPERVVGIGATWNHFSVLGVEPIHGRTFGPDEDRAGAPAPVAVISHSLWTRRFGREPDVVGREMVIGGRPHTILGVMPEGFRYPYSAEVWIPMGLGSDSEEWTGRFLNVSARLAEGVTPQRAVREMTSIAARLEEERPEANRDSGVRLISLREEILEGMDEKVRALFWAAIFVLLIATANVASMVLARAERQQNELSVRLALGAGRGDLVRPVLVEGLMLALAGAGLGLLAAQWAAPPLTAMSPVDDMGDFFQRITVGWRGAAFAVGAAGLVALLFTVPTLFRTLRQSPGTGVSRSRGGAGGSRRVLSGLVVGEVAVAVVLLTGAGLMVESIRNLDAVDLGVDPAGLAVFAISPSAGGYEEPDERMALVEGIVERVRGLPGVQSAAVTNFNPLKDQGWGARIWPTDRTPTLEQSSVTVNHRAVTPGFFETAGIRLLAGRAFTSADGAEAPGVAVVARSLAERLWPEGDPVGRELLAGEADDPEAEVVMVVGVAEDVADFGDVEGTWYRPLRQDPSEFPTGTLEIFVRAPDAVSESGALDARLVGAVRSAVVDADPSLPVFGVQAAPEIVRFERRMETFTTLLLSLFAGVGLLLAAVGIYGVLSYAVSRRAREIGIRQALGARPGDVVVLVLRNALGLAAFGLLLGLGAAAFLTRFLESFLVGVDPLDPGVFGLMGLGCLAVALGAAYLPARKAVAVDPGTVLAEE